MEFVELPKGWAKIVDLGESMRIEIPWRPRTFVGWFVFLIVGWFFLTGLISLASWLVAPPIPSQFKSKSIFFLLTILEWAIGTVLLGIFLLLILVGREEILVTPQELRIKRRPFGRQLRYRLSEIKNLRVIEDLSSVIKEPWLMWGMWWMVPGALAFDYGKSTVRFGAGVEVAEARQIVALIKERFEKYMKAGEG